MTLADLADGPYYAVAAFLGTASLCRSDAACRLTCELNRAQGGPWRDIGRREFHGLELDGYGLYDPEEGAELDPEDTGSDECGKLVPARSAKHERPQWKARYGRFRAEVRTFRSDILGAEVDQAAEIIYCRCKLRTDLLSAVPACGSRGVYLEVDVLANPDDVTLALVDFEGCGCSSVSFCPAIGAVIRERSGAGAYIQPLTPITSGQGFEGSIGLHLREGRIAFFRRAAPGEELELGDWETTGFITDLSFAEGRRLTPCLVFGAVTTGSYQISLTRLDASPPVLPEWTTEAYEDASWRID